MAASTRTQAAVNKETGTRAAWQQGVGGQQDATPFPPSCELQLGVSAPFYLALITVETIPAKVGSC